jgi:hypothetical protein
MSHRNLKISLALATALLALPVVASAQTSRVEGMNMLGDYIKDYSGIYTYVSEVANVGNLVYGELGNFTGPGGPPFDRSVGAVLGNLNDGGWGTFAIHLREWTPALGQGTFLANPNPGVAGLDPNSNQWESFDLMWAKKFGTTSFGLRLNRSFGKLEGDNGSLGPFSTLEFDFTGGDPNLNRNILGLGAGVGFELNSNTTAQLSVLYQNRTFELTDTAGAPVPVGFSDDGGTTFQIAGRMFWQWQPDVMVTPVFKYQTYDLSQVAPVGSVPATFDNSMSCWQIGVAGNWTLGQNDLFVLGLAFAQNKIEQEQDLFGAGFDNGTITETFMPIVFAGLETHVNSWLTLRFGANKGAWHSIKFEDEATPQTLEQSDSPFSMSLGAGVKLGPLQLDGVLNDNIAQNGLYFISGSSNTPLASKVTATYSF